MTALPPRIRTLTDRLDSLQVDAMLVTDEINVRYLSGFSGDSSYLIVRKNEAMILSDGRYETQIAQQCPSLTTAIRPPGQLMPNLLQQVVAGLSEKRIGIESAHVTVADFRRISELCPDVTWVETANVVGEQRMIKDDEEIRATRRAVDIAQRSFRVTRSATQRGLE